MRVVIVGATGNVGTSLVQALTGDASVQSILGLARRLPSWRPRGTEWAAADVRTDELVPHFQGADALVHLAWTFQPTRRPLVTWRNNVLGSVRVFRAAVEAGVPALVYASSIGAYSYGPEDDRPVDESWPTHALPTAAYGREKSYVERVLDGVEAANPEMRVVRLRPAFIFKRESASEQRRLFAGPLLGSWMVRPGFVPLVPDIPGVRFQALHSSDAAEAFRLVLREPVRGAFNVAAEPAVDASVLGELLQARPVRVPLGAARAAVSAAWRLRLFPASPYLLDLAVRAPLLDSTRIRGELGWRPQRTAVEAVRELLEGMRAGAGMATPPLEPGGAGRFRWRELSSGVGSRAGAA